MVCRPSPLASDVYLHQAKEEVFYPMILMSMLGSCWRTKGSAQFDTFPSINISHLPALYIYIVLLFFSSSRDNLDPCQASHKNRAAAYLDRPVNK